MTMGKIPAPLCKESEADQCKRLEAGTKRHSEPSADMNLSNQKQNNDNSSTISEHTLPATLVMQQE